MSGVHFGYTFCQAKVLSPILADGTHTSFFHAVLRTRLAAFYLHRCAFQYRTHFSAHPPLTIPQDMSPPTGEIHHAAVRLPPAPPSDLQVIVAPLTKMCPWLDLPIGFPTSLTSASLASTALASGQGWFLLQDPSISRAAMPESLI